MSLSQVSETKGLLDLLPMKVFVERIQECDQETAPVELCREGSSSSRRWDTAVKMTKVQALLEGGFWGRRQNTKQDHFSKCDTGWREHCLALGCPGGLSEQLMFQLSPEQPRMDLGGEHSGETEELVQKCRNSPAWLRKIWGVSTAGAEGTQPRGPSREEAWPSRLGQGLLLL